MGKEFIKYIQDMVQRDSFDEERSKLLYNDILKKFKREKSFNIRDYLSIAFLGVSVFFLGYTIHISNLKINNEYITSMNESLKEEVILDSEEIKYMDDINIELDNLLLETF
ncbi:MAG: hypothetical protein XD93_0253 [candidate division WS6 bacterium 34_10]|uniref:Uncharacterized protein n=1 Tax=candidate division WS6 bacterium 34_10 TaxID=1641389 RepID=A0A101HIZ9_9BACT|nr:MAG: hypothetical protein XD93_0253 [candidate division WS6 bacterium 34_10]